MDCETQTQVSITGEHLGFLLESSPGASKRFVYVSENLFLFSVNVKDKWLDLSFPNE